MAGAGALPHEATLRATDRLQWARSTRRREIGQALAALGEPETYGVVITGETRFGKSAVASALLEQIDPSVHTVRLRSTIVGSETPYGALAALIARLPPETPGDPASTMRGIQDILAADADGRPAVLALETSRNLDELSTAALVNIVVTGTAKLVIVADRTSDLPPDFHWMLAEDRLRDIPLPPLTPEETAAAVTELLGGLVPQTVSLELHTRARGNPQILLMTVAEMLRTGTLRVSGGVWMTAGADEERGAGPLRQVEDLVRARVEREPPEIRAVVEGLACARRLPLEILVRVYGPDVVVRMEESRLIVVDDGGRHMVALADPLIGDVVRSWLSVTRRRELRDLIMGGGEPAPELLTTFELLGFAAWTRECHSVLSPRLAIAAATASLRLYDAQFALRCLEGVAREQDTWAAVQRLRARASLLLQVPRQALASLDAVAAEESAAQSASDAAWSAAARAEALRWIPGRSDEAPRVLEDARGEVLVRSGMGREDADLERETGHALEILDLAEFEHFAFRGDFARIIDRLEAANAAGTAHDPDFPLMVQCLLMEARTAMGREQEGLALMHEVASALGGAVHEAKIRHEFGVRAFNVLLLNGHWRQCLALVKGTVKTPLARASALGGSLELGIGLAHVYAGRGAEALPSLLAATAMLEHQPVFNTLGAAYAATAFAYAQLGDTASAQHYLAKLDALPVLPCSHATSASTEFCSLLARRWAGDSGAVARLVESARTDIAAGRWTMAGLKLVGATVGATDDELRLLEDVCGRRQGSLARLGLLLARGTRTGALEDLIAAGDLAAELELDALEARCVAVAIDAARDAGDTVTVRLLQTRLDRLAGTRVPVLPVVPRTSLPSLTVREQEVAALAARGTSNRQIAEDLRLSVRTVEGHLYQVFSKLGVANRAELAAVL
ncbi:hypothetical protein GCM10028789_12530 [Sinomonas halotolerans]